MAKPNKRKVTDQGLRIEITQKILESLCTVLEKFGMDDLPLKVVLQKLKNLDQSEEHTYGNTKTNREMNFSKHTESNGLQSEDLITPLNGRTKSLEGRRSVPTSPGILAGREIPPGTTSSEVARRRQRYKELMSLGMEFAMQSTGMDEHELLRCAKMKWIPDGDWFFIRLATEPPDENYLSGNGI